MTSQANALMCALMARIEAAPSFRKTLIIFDALAEMAALARILERRADDAIDGLDKLMSLIETDKNYATDILTAWPRWCYLTGRETPMPAPAEEGKD